MCCVCECVLRIWCHWHQLESSTSVNVFFIYAQTQTHTIVPAHRDHISSTNRFFWFPFSSSKLAKVTLLPSQSVCMCVCVSVRWQWYFYTEQKHTQILDFMSEVRMNWNDLALACIKKTTATPHSNAIEYFVHFASPILHQSNIIVFFLLHMDSYAFINIWF